MAGRRRGVTDSLEPVNAHRWLVVRNRWSNVLDYQNLDAKTGRSSKHRLPLEQEARRTVLVHGVDFRFIR